MFTKIGNLFIRKVRTPAQAGGRGPQNPLAALRWHLVLEGLEDRAVPSAISDKYAALGGASGFLGQPTTTELSGPNGGSYQNFQNGSIFWSPQSNGAHEIHGPLLTKFLSLGGLQTVSYPTTDVTTLPDQVGQYASFLAPRASFLGSTPTAIYSSPLGTYEVHGFIREKFLSLGGPQVIGYPITDPTDTPQTAGWVSTFQSLYTTALSSIYWSSWTDAHEVHGPIRDKFLSLGGPAVLGFPSTDVTLNSDLLGRSSRFLLAFFHPPDQQHNKGWWATYVPEAIYWTKQTGAHSLFDPEGAIVQEFDGQGGLQFFGYPVTDSKFTADQRGRFNDFEILSNGAQASIYYSLSTGAHFVHGPIRNEFLSRGGEPFFGFPYTDETTTDDGIGKYNRFRITVSPHPEAEIYWTQSTGAHEVHGDIRVQWVNLGREKGLGYPTTDQIGTPDQIGQYNEFKNLSNGAEASIYWTQSTGARWLRGPIRDRWASLGREQSPLGYPTSAPYGISNYTVQHFQYGDIYLSSSNLVTEIHGPIWQRYNGTITPEENWSGPPVPCIDYLGLPISDVWQSQRGGLSVLFQKGAIYWSQNTGAHVLYDAIYTKWVSLGAETGLGFPTDDVQTPADGNIHVVRGVFEFGAIQWNVYWQNGQIVKPDLFEFFTLQLTKNSNQATFSWSDGHACFPQSSCAGFLVTDTLWQSGFTQSEDHNGGSKGQWTWSLSSNTAYNFSVDAVYEWGGFLHDGSYSGWMHPLAFRTGTLPTSNPPCCPPPPPPQKPGPAQLVFLNNTFDYSPNSFPDPKTPFDVYWNDKNVGGKATSAYKDHVWITPDDDPNKIVFAQDTPTLPSLNPGQVSPINRITVNGLPEGDYFVYVCLDYGGTTGTCLYSHLNLFGTGGYHIGLSPLRQTVAGTNVPLTVFPLDPYGDIITSFRGTVKFSSSDVQAGLPASYTFTAADNGVHTFNITLKTAGPQSITATSTAHIGQADVSFSGTQSGIVVTPAAAATLTLTGLADGTWAGIPGLITVTARDAYGNVATGYHGTIHFTSSDAQADLPANYTFTASAFTAADNGVHSFSITLKTAGNQSLTATDTATASIAGTRNGIGVNAASASMLFLGLPERIMAGVAGNLTVIARDAYGNIATGYRGTVHFSSSDSRATLPADYTFTAADNGVHVFQITLKTAGSQAITARETGTSNLTASAKVTVTRATLTITPAAGQAKLYGAAVPVLSYAATGFISGDTASLLTGLLGTTATPTSPVGNYAFTLGTLSAGANYTLVLPASAPTFAVTPAPLTVTAADQAKVYGQANPTLTAAYTGFVNGDTPAVVRGLTLTTTATVASGVGTYPITASGATAANYTIRYVSGTLTVTRAQLSITADNKTKVYGQANPALTATYSGFVNGDTSAVVSGLSLTTTATTSSGVGTYAITAAGATTANYTIAFANGTLTVNRAPLSITADNKTRVAGTTITLTATYTGLVNGDTPAVVTSLTLSTYQGNTTGTYAIIASGATAANYTITHVNGTLTVIAGSLDHFGVTTSVDASGTTAGNPFDVTVTAQDAFNNTVTAYGGTITFSSADPYSATLPADYTFQGSDQGQATLAGGATLYTAGTWDVTVTDTTTGATGSDCIAVTAAPAVAFQVIAPVTATSGQAFDITVIAVDLYGNTDMNYQGTVTFTTSDLDPGVMLPADYTFQATDAGMVTFPAGVTLITLGDQTLTATDTVSNIMGSATITVGGPTGPVAGGSGRDSARSLGNAGEAQAHAAQPVGGLVGQAEAGARDRESRDQFFAAWARAETMGRPNIMRAADRLRNEAPAAEDVDLALGRFGDRPLLAILLEDLALARIGRAQS